MDPIIRSSSVDTLSNQIGTLSTNGNPQLEDYLLLSCHINAYVDPPKILCERMPVSVPDYVKARKTIIESDLYFLQWVFKDLFDGFNDIIARDYPDYNILRAEVEPGISWEDFRCDQRGLMVWLVKTRPDPHQQFARLLERIEKESPTAGNRELISGVLSKHVAAMRRQIRRLRREIDQSEQQFDEIWRIISNSLDVASVFAIAGRSPRAQGKEPADWSVVEDETDDHELTSASLSGYDEYDSASEV
jgi:hypothetical protein